MGQFLGEKIVFNGIDSEQFGLYLCNIDTDNTRNFGLEKSITDTVDSWGNSTINSISYKSNTYPIQLIKVNKRTNSLLPITDFELSAIKRWLFSSDEYGQLIIKNSKKNEHTEYYGMFVKGSICQNSVNHGYITVDFKMAMPYGYLMYQDYECEVVDKRVVLLESMHEFKATNPVDIELNVFGTDVTVINNTNGQRVELRGIDDTCRKIRIYNDRIRHIVNLDNPKMNMRDKFNKVYLELEFGDNEIEIIGNCYIKFYNRPKVMIC